MHLYELKENYLKLAELDDEGDENFAEAIENSLAEIKDDFNDKAIDVIKVAKNFKAEAAAIDSEIKNMQARKKALLNKDTHLREYLRKNMIETGINKISCPFFTISLRNSKASVIVDDEKQVPQEYIETIVTEKIDKNRLYGDLKGGADIPGCHLKENK